MRILSLFLALILLSPIAMAKGPGGGGGGMKRMLRQLDLTQEQKDKLKEMRGSKKGEMKALREKKRAMHKKVQEAMGGDASEATLRSLHTEAQALERQMADLRFEQILAVRKVLTPEQRKKFSELHQDRRGHGERKRGKRRMGNKRRGQ